MDFIFITGGMYVLSSPQIIAFLFTVVIGFIKFNNNIKSKVMLILASITNFIAGFQNYLFYMGLSVYAIGRIEKIVYMVLSLILSLVPINLYMIKKEKMQPIPYLLLSIVIFTIAFIIHYKILIY